MDLNKMIAAIKANPNFHKAGMIASHIGVVRSFSRDGKPVQGVDVEFDHEKIQEILTDIKSRPGILDILVDSNSGYLGVGDEIMTIVVAGDIRENVLPALSSAISRLKAEAATKNERVID